MALNKPGIVRVELDNCIGGGAMCSIYMTWDTYDAEQYRSTRTEALAAAVAQWRKHRKWSRKQRQEYALKRTLHNDPIQQMARQVEADIADARAAVERSKALSAVAARFYTDESVDSREAA